MQKKNDKIVYISLLCLFLLLVVLVVRSLTYEQTEHGMPELSQIAFVGEYSTDGGTWQALGDGDNIADGHRTILVRGNFVKDIPQNETLWLRVENIGVIVRVNGEQVFDCNQPGSFPAMFNAPGYAWCNFKSSGITAKDEIELELLSYYKDSQRSADALLGSLYIGDGNGLYRLLMERFDIIALLVLLAMIAGIIYLIEGFIYKMFKSPEAERVMLLGFYCFSGGLWCITDSFYPYFSLILSPPWLASVIDMSGIMLFPISLVLLVRYFVKGKISRRVMSGVALASIIVIFVCLSLQFFGVADLHQQQAWIGGTALMLLAVTLVSVALDLKRRSDNYLLLFLAIVPTAAALLFDGINLFFPYIPRRFMMRYGFTFSAVLMLSWLFDYGKRETEAQKRIESMKAELTESRVSIMLSQIQPHFLYNALNTIMNLCYIDGEKAGNAVASFAKYLRGNLDSINNRTCISFTQELAHLKNYLVLEQLRFPDVHIIYNIQESSFFLPPLTLQPLVENAIRYGVTRREAGGTVNVSTYETETDWLIEIKDDGVGFNPDEKPDDGRSHVGINNTRERLATLCGGRLIIESAMGVGTTVTINIPKEIDNENYLRR